MSTTTPHRKVPKWVWPVLIGLLVAGALVAAVGMSGGSGDTDPALVELQQNAAVAITGTELPAFEQGVADPAVGERAPQIEGTDFTGTPVQITPGDGKRYMIAFLAHWCPHCQAEVPRLVEWSKQGGAGFDLEVVAVSTAVNAQQPNYPPSAWLEREQWPAAWPVIADSEEMEVSAAFGQAGFPFFVFVDADGTVLHRHAGELGLDAIKALVAETFGS